MLTAHRALRDGTAAAHARVDEIFSRFDLAERAGYAAFLSAHADAMLPFEAALDTHAAAVVDDWPARRRGRLLVDDLAALGAEPPDRSPAALAADAEAAGVLYVLEGSRMGARLLARRVGPNLPKSFLDAHHGADGWRALLARLDAVLADAGARDSAVAAAARCFDAFEAAGRKWLVSA